MKRTAISLIQPRWYDGQRVDQQDLLTDLSRNTGIDASIVNNHFGSGVLSSAISQKVVMDTDNLFPDQVVLISSHDFDGTGLLPLAQPTDTTLGNMLEVEYTDSDSINGFASAFGRLTVKVFIIGVDFKGDIQWECFTFARKEKQVTRKHYARILSVLFNDFLGNNNCSMQLGGRVIIRESASFQLSRDPIMIDQSFIPHLPFRDFKVSNFSAGPNPTTTLNQTLQTAIGTEFTVDAMNINTTVKRNFDLVAGDVTTKAAQKFLAKTNNIQKITILLGATADPLASSQNKYNWSGEFVVNVYALQSSVNSPSDLVPGLAIEFEPAAQPLTQFTLDINDLKDLGYVLNDTLQPIDLIFNNSLLGNSVNNTAIIPGTYYIFTINRAGDASTGTLFTGIGNNTNTDETRFTVFAGGVWTDVPDESMWYEVWTDAAKVCDGQAYDAGNGIQIEKTAINSIGATVDYCFGLNTFADNGQSTLNTAVIEAILTPSNQEQDERTGNPVYSRQTFEPSFSFVSAASLTNLKASSDPLIIGCARDVNAKGNSVITGNQTLPGLVNGDIFRIVNPDANILSQQLIGSKLIPNDDCQAFGYKIYDVKICTDGYGDVNGDGTIDFNDVSRVAALLGESVYYTSTQQKIKDGYIDVLELLRADVDGDGYVTSADVSLINDFVNKSIATFPVGSSFRHAEIRVQQSVGRNDGYYTCSDGYVRLGVGNTVPASSLDIYQQMYDGYLVPVNMELTDTIFLAIPFVTVPFRIQPLVFWQDWMLQFSSEARLVPAAFTNFDESPTYRNKDGSCNADAQMLCEDPYNFVGACNPGRNDLLVPNDLVIRDGQIKNIDGTHFKQDVEVNHIIIELPNQVFTHNVINIFDKCVADYSNGYTSAGFPAMKFADCSYVGTDALLKNQVRFGVELQSLYHSIIVNMSGGFGTSLGDRFEQQISIYIDSLTGILTLSADQITINNGVSTVAPYISMPAILLNDPLYKEKSTKIQVTVFLKKAGWNNNVLTIDSAQASQLFV